MKHALRQLLQSPGFSAIALLMLALGIGLSASSFSMANAFLLRNVPYPDADRLVRLFSTNRQSDRRGHAPGNLIELRESATSFSHFSFYNIDDYSLGDPGQPAEQVAGLSATAEFFDTLGVHPTLGRGFLAGEDQPDQPDIVVLTFRCWTRRYANDPAAVGRTLRINARPYTIVGVLPATFEAPLVWGPVEFVTPRTLALDFRANRKDSWMSAVARLKPGVSLAQAQSELSTLAARLAQEFPKENGDRGLRAADLATSNMDSVSRSLLWLMTGISLVMLLVACANLASLQIARAFGRAREFAVRAALGASSRQLMTPLLLESLLLAVAGGVAGLAVASWSNQIIGHFLLINNEPGYAIPLDGRVLAFAAFASLLSGVAFGLAPAWLASRSPAGEALKEGSRSSTSSRSHQRLKNGLIIAELALALVLVGVAAAFGLGARSFVNRQVGWDSDPLFTGYLALPYEAYHEEAKNRAFQRALLAKLAVLPGVEQAVLCRRLPLSSLGGSAPFVVDGQPVDDPTRRPIADIGSVSPDFFAALRIPLKRGRIFSASLAERDPPVAVINEAFAQRFWPGQDPIGRRVKLGDSEQWIEIIGVVGDVGMLARFTAPETRLQLYRPLFQSPTRYLTIALRTTVAPETLTKSVRDAVSSIDADLPVAQPGSFRAGFERNLANLNLVVINLSLSAAMGLLIAGVGLFGVISQLTAQRTRDIGVRIALGASYRDIMAMIIGQGARLLAVGLVLGIPGYYALTTVVHRAMPEMQLPGLWLLATNVVVLSFTAMLACWTPAQRATRVNPVDALRAE